MQPIEILEILPIQYFKKLDGTSGILEVRIDFGGDTFRLLRFFDKGNLVMLINRFLMIPGKKSIPNSILTSQIPLVPSSFLNTESAKSQKFR